MRTNLSQAGWEGIEPQDHVGTKDLGKTVDSIVCETLIERAPASG